MTRITPTDALMPLRALISYRKACDRHTRILSYLPTTRSSVSDGFFRNRVQISIVKMVEEELKMDVRELMRAASMTASNKPESPTNSRLGIES